MLSLRIPIQRMDQRFGSPGKPKPIRLRSRTRQRVGVCGSWNCSAMAGSVVPPASRITWAAASRPSNASLKPSAWPAASSSSWPQRVHRSEQDWDLPASGNVNAILDLLQFHHRSFEPVANRRRHIDNSKQLHKSCSRRYLKVLLLYHFGLVLGPVSLALSHPKRSPTASE